jgi:hypothetical protein
VITSSWPRLVIGTILLFVGAAEGYLAWGLETCTGGAAGSLLTGGLVTLATNMLAWLLLARRVPSKLVLFVAALPALAALGYTLSTVQLTGALFNGQGACELISGEKDIGRDGREAIFVILWWLASLSFWAGLATVARRAITIWKERGA